MVFQRVSMVGAGQGWPGLASNCPGLARAGQGLPGLTSAGPGLARAGHGWHRWLAGPPLAWLATKHFNDFRKDFNGLPKDLDGFPEDFNGFPGIRRASLEPH